MESKITIQDGKVLDCPNYIKSRSIENDVVYLVITKNCNLEIIYQQDKPLHVYIVIEDGLRVNIIETKNVSHLNKKMMVLNNANVTVFSYNKKCIETIEDIEVYEAAVEVAYCELEDHDVKQISNYHLVKQGAHISTRLAALSSGKSKKLFDISLLHEDGNTSGDMKNYGVVRDEGNIIINGIGRIGKGNSGSSTHQTSKIMMFNEKCKAQANPYLYIDENDVQASHAASVGKMDENHLYYLQTRGIEKQEAMKLITLGYLVPVVDMIKNESLKEKFREILQRKIGE